MKTSKNDLFKILCKIDWPKHLIYSAIVLSIISTSLTLSIPYLTGRLVDYSTKTNQINAHFVIILISLFFMTTIFNSFNIYLLSKIGENIVLSIKSKVWSHLLYLPLKFHDNNSSGNLMSRITEDTDIINTFVSDRIPSIIPSILTLIGTFFILLSLSWQLTCAIFILVPLFFFFIIPLGRIVEKNSINIQDKISEFNGLLGRVLSEMKLVKISSSENLEIQRGKYYLKEIYILQLKEAKIRAIILPLTGTLLMIMLSIILVYGGTKVADSTISSGALISIIFYIIQLIAPISSISTLTTEHSKALGASKRLSEIYQVNKESNNNYKFNRSFREINFKNISFSYEDDMILDKISFTIKKGEKIAIVGPSGSGKSTIFNIFERLYDINEGEILIDEINIKDINLESWRNFIGYVSQKNPMMYGSVKENILYGIEKTIDDKELYEYLKVTEFMNFIEKLPKMLNTQVGEQGNKLSGGQIQKINIIRNFIKNPEVVLFDEPTSNLDSESELDLQKSMNRLLKNRTSIIISHKLSTIKDVDKIIFLDNGKVTGIGTHQELITVHKKYKKFVDSQTL